MTAIKFDPKVLADVEEALEEHADEMFKRRTGRWMAVVELAHVERVEPGPDEEKVPTVKMRIVAIEVAPDADADERLRAAQQRLYVERTSGGTFDSVTPDGHRADDILRNGTGLLASVSSR